MDYKNDLRAENETDIRCVDHSDRRAIACDLDSWGFKVPVCEECWRKRYPLIRTRLAEQRLVLGGLKERTV